MLPTSRKREVFLFLFAIIEQDELSKIEIIELISEGVTNKEIASPFSFQNKL